MTAREKTERRIQSEIFLYHWNMFPKERGLMFEINNNPINAIDGARRKAIGMVSGVSDLIYLHPDGAIGIEIKTPEGKQSARQVWWESVVESFGMKYYVIRSLKEFKEKVLSVQK